MAREVGVLAAGGGTAGTRRGPRTSAVGGGRAMKCRSGEAVGAQGKDAAGREAGRRSASGVSPISGAARARLGKSCRCGTAGVEDEAEEEREAHSLQRPRRCRGSRYGPAACPASGAGRSRAS